IPKPPVEPEPNAKSPAGRRLKVDAKGWAVHIVSKGSDQR
ncbi:hypothetical protein ACN42_g10606, partial [Penicillium freii]